MPWDWSTVFKMDVENGKRENAEIHAGELGQVINVTIRQGGNEIEMFLTQSEMLELAAKLNYAWQKISFKER